MRTCPRLTVLPRGWLPPLRAAGHFAPQAGPSRPDPGKPGEDEIIPFSARPRATWSKRDTTRCSAGPPQGGPSVVAHNANQLPQDIRRAVSRPRRPNGGAFKIPTVSDASERSEHDVALVAVRSPTPYLSRVRSGWAKCRIVEDGNVDQGGFRRASLRALPLNPTTPATSRGRRIRPLILAKGAGNHRFLVRICLDDRSQDATASARPYVSKPGTTVTTFFPRSYLIKDED
ncbi:hypothetical protein FOMPIDRAFT_1053867 [Fomitopsis schrenkii]|uniref:Uncharacterized protein n=1 Tax=Fomitopsis schrenkii TaxID=2126942 RepID=S8DR84_FOMSC|nr:hypothetical protein FOMPIDRAFT_1053867 [Fomitopsis schrenkii]